MSQNYYKRPELGTSTENLALNIQSVEAVVKAKDEQLTGAKSKVEDAGKWLDFWEKQVKVMQGIYEKSPAKVNADKLAQAQIKYQVQQGVYNNAVDAYNQLGKEYGSVYSHYSNAVNTYNDYVQDQQGQYTAWKGTIRDADTVRGELDVVGSQIEAQKGIDAKRAEAQWQKEQDEKPWYEKLAGYLGEVQDTSLPTSQNNGQSKIYVSPQMQALLDKQALLQDELNWSEYFKYADLMEAADFEEKSQYETTYVEGKEKKDNMGGWVDTGYTDINYDYINRNTDARTKGWSNDNRANLTWTGNDRSYLAEMTDDEIAIFNYLYATRSPEEAYAYTAYLTSSLNQRQRLAAEEKSAKYAQEHPVLSSIGTVLTSPLKVIGYAGQLADYAQDGKIDENAGYNKYSYTSTAIREQVAKDIEKSGKWGKVGSFAYQTGMSMADFLLTTAITGGNEAVALTIMGTGAAADTTIAAKDRGLDDDQAFMLGTVAGIAEAACEKIGLDAMLGKLKLGKGRLGYILTNALAEGSEEGLTSFANLAADILISQDKSQWQAMVDQYVAEGYDEGEAFGKAFLDQAAAIGLDILGGVISGGLIGSGGAAIDTVSNIRQYGKLDKGTQGALMLQGASAQEGSKANTLAQKALTQIAQGKELSGRQLYQLAQQTQKQVTKEDAAKIQQAVQSRLQELGEVGELSGLSEAITRQAVGDPLTVKQERMIYGSQYGQRVANELNAENIRSGQYASDWVEKIGTRSIHPQEYGSRIEQNADTQGETEQVQHEGAAERIDPEETRASFYQDAEPGTVAEEEIVSVAERVRREDSRQGGTKNGKQAGNRVSDGGSQRHDGQSAREQAGGLESSTGSAKSRAASGANQAKRIVARQNRAQHLRQQGLTSYQSSNELGIPTGTDTKNVTVLPESAWDEELQAVAQRVKEETGNDVTFVVGRIQVKTKQGTANVRGVRTPDGRIIVQVDNKAVTAEQIADHEMYHDKVARNLGLHWRIRKHVALTFTEDQLRDVVDRYLDAMEGILDTESDSYNELVHIVEEEVLADAYAGINAFGKHADQFTGAVKEKMQELGYEGTRQQENGVRETDGPPAGQKENTAESGVRYSMADVENYATREQKNTDTQIGVQYSAKAQESQANKVITSTMSDAERSTILRGKQLVAPIYEGQADAVIKEEKPNLESGQDKLIKAALVRIGEEFEVFTDYDIEDVDVKITLSRGNLRESVSKKANPTQIAKLLPVLKNAVEKSVGVESHKNRYFYDNTTISFDNLIGGYVDGEYFVPVRFGLKHIRGGEVTLYVVIDQQKIKAEVLKPITQTSGSTGSRSAYTINIAQIVPFVNSKDLLRYLPDDMLTNNQKTAKWEGIAETIIYTNDKNDEKYRKFIDAGNMQAAKMMVDAAAKANGYTIKAYHGTTNRQEKSTWNPTTRTWDTEYQRITVFKKQYPEQVGHFFNSDIDNAGGYGFDLYPVYLMLKKPLVIDCKGQNYASITYDGKEMDTYEWAAYAKKQRYDGVIFENISDGVGYDDLSKLTTDYVVFDSNRIKSAETVVYDNNNNAIPISQRFNPRSNDIRYSLDEDTDTKAEKPAEKAKRPRPKPVAESKPIEAKKKLRGHILDLFSIPDGRRAEMGIIIDSYADQLIKRGTLTETERKNFFDRMYEYGVMTVPADEYMALGRETIYRGKIYVNDRIRQEFGDDWNEIRRRAFAAGVYLTGNRSDAGIDSWNADLAEALPGLFDSEETDLRSILERIVEVAEEGRDEKVSLAEYTARLADIEHVSEDEYLDTMERQMDWALRSFAESAEIEIKLRDRTGVKIAQEREKAAQQTAKERVRQAQRRAEERQERKEKAERQRQRKELRELQQKTLKALQWLSKNRNRAPEELRAAWDEVLGDLDVYAVGAANEMRWNDRYNATWKDLAQMYKEAKEKDPNFMPSKELEIIVSRLDNDKIADMDFSALTDLYKAAVGLRTEFYNRNNVISDEMHRLFAEVYTDSKAELEAAPGRYTGSKADRHMNMDQLTPMNVLQRMGGWDPNGTFFSMARQLENGERDMRAYKVKANRMLEAFLTEHEDWVKRADGQGKDAIWYELEVPQLLELGMGDKPIFGPTVKVSMTPAQKVHMYLESKNQDNLRHMTGGRTFADKALYSEGKRQEAFAQGRTIRLAPETVKQIVSDLTAEEQELARILDRFYNDFSKQEINRVSNVLYGYDKAMGSFYAPIFTNRNYVKSEIGVFDTTAEGVGNMKGRQYAVNPSYQISAFDAFERSVDQTSRFVGMAIPARNWNTLLNWREKNTSMSDVITHEWGDASKNYITDLINELQSGTTEERSAVKETTEKLLSNYISSVFGANPGIVLKQLGSIPLAGTYLGMRNMPSPQQLRDIDRTQIAKYTQDLDWRSLGYSMPETKQLKDNPNWTQTNKFTRFTFGGGAITEMDTWAASTLWPWAENKVRKEHPELEVGTSQQVDAGESPFYKKVAEEFEYAVSRSQSVADTTHQSSLRKSKSVWARALTMFRSDSAQTYNAIRQKIGEAQFYKRTGADTKVVKSAQRAVGATFLAALGNFVLAEIINFLVNMWKRRGKDYRDEEGQLTLQSIATEAGTGILQSFAGIVVGGEELAEMIGTLFTGEKWYGVESTQVSVVTDLLDTAWKRLGSFRDIVAEGATVVSEGGDLGEYFRRNGNTMLGEIKDTAKEVAAYLGGVPAENVEAYLIGLLKNTIPGFDAAYEDVFKTAEKSALKGLTGENLTVRVGDILENRKVSRSDDTAHALAELYESGFAEAVPTDTPTRVTVDKEERELTAYQQQVFDAIWSSTVSEIVDDLVVADHYLSADQEARAKMLKVLYDYAADQAKTELFDEYEPGSAAVDIAEFQKAGLDVIDYLAVRGAGADPDKTLKQVQEGMDVATSIELQQEIEDLEPLEDNDKVVNVQKWRSVLDFIGNPTAQRAALYSYMTPQQYKKLDVAGMFGVSNEDYVRYHEIRAQFDANGNGSYSQAEITAAIDSMSMSGDEKAALWQVITGAKKADKNPYSKAVGQKVLDEMSAE